MRDELTKTETPAPSDPVTLGRQNQAVPLRQRFYKTVEVAAADGGFAVMLDGKPILTPAKARLTLPTSAAAAEVAAEWQAQDKHIDPSCMPITRIVNAALDGVAAAMEAVSAELVQYAGSDLVCYRAEGPASLLKAEAAAWDPILAFAGAELGAVFICAEGVMPVSQPEPALASVRARLKQVTQARASAPIALACLHVMTTLTGSVLIALARVHGVLSLEQAWAAAHVDEDFQMGLWGADGEALAKRARRFTEMEAADRLWQCLAG